MVRASNWSMILLLSISPAGNVNVGRVMVFPQMIVTEACAPRYPSAMATAVYVPGEIVNPNVPSGLADTEAASVLSGLYKLIVTSLDARICPVSIPKGRGVGVGEATGVNVAVGVGDSTGISVDVGNG